jgi:MerR family transcriptional regulator, light-induced transcriptional regulator
VQLLSVGEVAARLGVSPSAVRMWGTRYGLTASARSEGGHRRYTGDDVARLQVLHEAVLAGEDPAAAAGVERAGRRGGPGGAGLAVPGAGREARGLARAAARLDELRAEDAVLSALQEHGTTAAWDEVVRPVLVAAGSQWATTGGGVEIEHLLTQAVVSALVRHTAALPDPPSERPVLLAGGPQEEHVLPLHAVRAALTERGIPARLLGPRTPATALAAAARRTRAAAVVVWLSRPDEDPAAVVAAVATAHRRVRVLLGGPGWDGAPEGATLCASLAEAVELAEVAWRR